MCGRFSLSTDKDDIQSRYGIDPTGVLLGPRYNIAPSQLHPVVVVESDQRVLKLMKWGLVPHWAKDERIGYKMINARADTVDTKPSFKNAFKKRRCLVITTGFYEWDRTDPKNKRPFHIGLKSKKPFAFAGLWESWGPDNLQSFTIITTDANELVSQIHDRMPVILHEKDEAAWLDPELHDPAKLKPLLVPYPAEEMEMYEVSTIVNSPKNESPDCIKPI